VYFKIREEKPHIAFSEIVEGSRIYNFYVQRLVNFYTKIWRKMNSNTAPATRVRVERQHATTSRAARRRLRA
jgi:hypothetical protein